MFNVVERLQDKLIPVVTDVTAAIHMPTSVFSFSLIS